MSKTILITGSGSGPGNVIAGALSDEGHGVIAAIEIIGEYNKIAADELGSIPNTDVIYIDLNNSLPPHMRMVDRC